MFKLIKRGLIWNKIANSFGKVHKLIIEAEYDIKCNTAMFGADEAKKSITLKACLQKAAYYTKIEIYDVAEKSHISMINASIHVPSIINKPMPIDYIKLQTIGKLYQLANEYNYEELVDSIIDGGEEFKKIEQLISIGY